MQLLRRSLTELEQQRRNVLSEPNLLLSERTNLLILVVILLVINIHLVILVDVGDAAFIIILQNLKCARAVTHLVEVRVCRDTNDTSTTEGREVIVLELLGDGPGDEITRRAEATVLGLADGLLRDFTLKTDLPAQRQTKFVRNASCSNARGEGRRKSESLLDDREGGKRKRARSCVKVSFILNQIVL